MSRGRVAAAALAGAAALLGATGAWAQCLSYEPAQVVLVGRLRVEAPAAPGAPPSFGLRLDRPICLTPGSGAPGENGVRNVELAFPRGGAFSRDQGRRIAVSGSLFRRQAGRRERLALNVSGLGRVR